MGMAKVRGKREEEDVDGAGIGLSTSTVRDTTMYPGSRLSGEITPLLLLVSAGSELTALKKTHSDELAAVATAGDELRAERDAAVVAREAMWAKRDEAVSARDAIRKDCDEHVAKF